MAELCALTFRRVPEWSGPLTVSYLTRTNCRSWVKRQFAAPTIRGILGVESPSPDMTVPVTKLPIAGRRLIGGSGSTLICCAAQFNVSFLRS
jgi:hypothetical protein